MKIYAMYDIEHTALDTVVKIKSMVSAMSLMGMPENLVPILKGIIADKSTENQMDYAGLLIFIVIGAVVGWLAGILMKGGGLGLLGNIIIGIVGAIAGGVLFGLLGLIGSIFTAIVGAAILLFLVWFIMKSKHQS